MSKKFVLVLFVYLFTYIDKLQVKILKELHRYQEAIELQEKLIHNANSVHKKNLPFRIIKITKEYEENQLILEQEKKEAQLKTAEL